jgi:myo-inositol-1(or 4)-monophosphatase
MRETLADALKASGQELLKNFNQSLKVKIKESQSSIVTEADMKSNSVIIDLLRSRFPSHNILSEETGFTNQNSSYTWVIDPLDGTSNFASSLPWFGVLIAMFEGNIPVLGGAYLPVYDQMYIAIKGEGVFLNGRQMPCLEEKELINSLVAFAVDYSDDEIFLNRCMSIYKGIVKGARNIRCTNSLVDFLYVAGGKLGGVVNLFTRVWDIAALGLILSEAGGRLTNLEGTDVVYKISESILDQNFPVIAGSETTVSALVKIAGETK